MSTYLTLVYSVPTIGTVIELPLDQSEAPTGVLNGVNWGDGSSDDATNFTHEYQSSGSFTVAIDASGFTKLKGNSSNAYLTAVTYFGTQMTFTDFTEAFKDAVTLTSVPSSLPGTVTNLTSAFEGATSFDSSNITGWVTTNVTNMSKMFKGAIAFNQNISSWNTQNVTTMADMFNGATAFNQNISSWNTQNVTTMANMFKGATAFDHNISTWTTTNVTNMSGMFNNAAAFNQNISTWTTGNVTTMANMFNGATAFSQDISAWNFSAATVMMDFLSNAPNFGITNYNTLLNVLGSLANAGSIISGTPFRNVGQIYTSASSASRTNLMGGGPRYWVVGGDLLLSSVPVVQNASFTLTMSGATTLLSGGGILPSIIHNFAVYEGLSSRSNMVQYTTNGSTDTLTLTNIVIPTAGTGIYNIVDTSNGNAIIARFGLQVQAAAAARTPCFLEGSQILCYIDDKETYLPIEQMKPGTLVKTLLNGYKKVVLIGKGTIENPATNERLKNRLYTCSTANYPELTNDLVLTGCHSILVEEITDKQRAETMRLLGRMFATDDKYRLMACIDERAEPLTTEGAYTIWHFALEHDDQFMNYGVFANGGLLVETCSQRNMRNNSNLVIQ